jgi:hypothetical protein
MIGALTKAARIYRQSKSHLPVKLVNGCCYGRQRVTSEDKKTYFKICGQRFWEFISGMPDLYKMIVEPLGHRAKERNDEFRVRYDLVVDKFTEEFRKLHCLPDGGVDWPKLAELASAPLKG